MSASEAAASVASKTAAVSAAARETIADGESREESGSHNRGDHRLACHGMLLPQLRAI